MNIRALRCAVVAGVVFSSLGVMADQARFVGARATGMAGANVASVNDATAQWHNPAAFGFMNQETNAVDNNGLSENDWGWNLVGIGAGYNMTEDMGRYLDILANVDFDNLSDADINNPDQVRDLISLAAALKGISEDGNSFYVDTSVASSMRMGSFGIGFRLFNETALWVDNLDSANLGLDAVDAAELTGEIESAALGDVAYQGLGGYSATVLSAGQQALLLANLSPDSVNYLDYQLNQLLDDGTIEQADIDNAAELLTDIVDATAAGGGGELDDNETVVAARGFAIAEIPLSYGYAVNDQLSLGITAKAMFGRVLGTRVWVFDEDNLEDAVESVSDTESDTLAFGLDLAAMYRIKNFQFGAIGRNLNSPTFDGYTDSVVVNGVEREFRVNDVTLDPQITVGAAFIPSERLTLEIDYDLLDTGTLLDGYDIRRLSIGAECDLWVLDVRGGVYKNLAMSDEDWVATAGLGVNLYLARLDVGGAISLGDNAEVNGEDIPTQARLYAGLGIQF